MSTIQLNEDHDWTLNVISDNKATTQNCVTQLLSWQNDCFFNLEDGLPYENIIGYPLDEEELNFRCQQRLQNVQDVQSVLSINTKISEDKRKITIDFIVQTTTDAEIEKSLFISI